MTIESIVDDVVVYEISEINEAPISIRKQFNDFDGDITVTMEVLVADF